MADFTPGPWLAEPALADGLDYDWSIRADDHSTAMGFRFIGRVGNGRGSLEVATANARLILAAPELLAACQMMIPKNVCLTNRNVRDDVLVSLDVPIGDLRKISAAIALAIDA